MSAKTRRVRSTGGVGVRAAVLLVVIAVGLGGCIRSNVEMKVKSNDRLDGKVLFAISDKFLNFTGKTTRSEAVKQLQVEVKKSAGKLPKQAKTSFYDKGGYIGQELVFTDLPAADFNKVTAQAGILAASTTGLSGTSVSLVRKNNLWEFGGTIDLSAAKGLDQSALGDSAKPDVRVKVTFPGSIVSKDKWAKVSGRTVSWNPKVGEKVVMAVTARTR